MKHSLKTISEILEESLYTWSRSSLFAIVDEVDATKKELREHYKEYKELAKPAECDETWYCLQYLELLIEEILGEVDEGGLKKMDYCEFIKCYQRETRFDLGGCGIACSGETCYSLDPDKDSPKYIAYEIHLEEMEETET